MVILLYEMEDLQHAKYYVRSAICTETIWDVFFPLLLWLADEYKEPKPKPTLTEKEMYLCKAYSSGYIARDESRVLHFFTNKPQKGLTGWWATDSIYAIIPPPQFIVFIH